MGSRLLQPLHQRHRAAHVSFLGDANRTDVFLALRSR